MQRQHIGDEDETLLILVVESELARDQLLEHTPVVQRPDVLFGAQHGVEVLRLQSLQLHLVLVNIIRLHLGLVKGGEEHVGGVVAPHRLVHLLRLVQRPVRVLLRLLQTLDQDLLIRLLECLGGCPIGSGDLGLVHILALALPVLPLVLPLLDPVHFLRLRKVLLFRLAGVHLDVLRLEEVLLDGSLEHTHLLDKEEQVVLLDLVLASHGLDEGLGLVKVVLFEELLEDGHVRDLMGVSLDEVQIHAHFEGLFEEPVSDGAQEVSPFPLQFFSVFEENKAEAKSFLPIRVPGAVINSSELEDFSLFNQIFVRSCFSESIIQRFQKLL